MLPQRSLGYRCFRTAVTGARQRSVHGRWPDARSGGHQRRRPTLSAVCRCLHCAVRLTIVLSCELLTHTPTGFDDWVWPSQLRRDFRSAFWGTQNRISCFELSSLYVLLVYTGSLVFLSGGFVPSSALIWPISASERTKLYTSRLDWMWFCLVDAGITTYRP